MDHTISHNANKYTWIGGLFILPALYFVFAAVLEAYLGITTFIRPLEAFYATPQSLSIWNTLSPIIFLGGILIGAMLGLIPILHLKINRPAAEIQLSFRLKTRFGNLVIIGTGFALFSMMISYALVENLGLGI